MSISLCSDKVRSLIFGVVGIYSFYSISGVLHQRLIKRPHYNIKTQGEEFFSYPIAFVIITTFIAWISGLMYNKYKGQDKLQIPTKKAIKCGMMVLISGITLNQAIYLTSFPIVMMFKTCNLLAVVLVGLFCSKVRSKQLKLGKSKLLVAFIVTVGIVMYNFLGNDEEQSGSTSKKQSKEDKFKHWLGIFILIISLFADGFLPEFQAQIKQQIKPSPMQMLQHINKWVCILSLIYSIVVKFQVLDISIYLIQHPFFSLQIFGLSVFSTIGQIFVYRMIKQFKQHVVPFVITTRKIFSVLLSIVIFNHIVTIWQLLGVLIVFVTVVIQFVVQIRSEQKIQNQKQQAQMNNQEGPIELIEQQVNSKPNEEMFQNSNPNNTDAPHQNQQQKSN